GQCARVGIHAHKPAQLRGVHPGPAFVEDKTLKGVFLLLALGIILVGVAGASLLLNAWAGARCGSYQRVRPLGAKLMPNGHEEHLINRAQHPCPRPHFSLPTTQARKEENRKPLANKTSGW
ncbi:MAG: hypothetical protein HC880_03300, partial [Bacteroidia bacterium]|nr:hypothetical protein [Bacteroidia bacterium]